MQIPITALSIILVLVQVPANLFAWVWENKVDFGRSVVLFRFSKHGSRRHLRIVELFSSFIPLVFVYGNILFVLGQ